MSSRGFDTIDPSKSATFSPVASVHTITCGFRFASGLAFGRLTQRSRDEGRRLRNGN